MGGRGWKRGAQTGWGREGVGEQKGWGSEGG